MTAPEPNSKRGAAKKRFARRRAPFSLKTLAYAVISFFGLIPVAYIGFFQQTNFAQETIEEFALNFAALAHEAKSAEISPDLAVAWMRSNKLVLWASYFKDNKLVAHSGLPLRPEEAIRVQDINLKSDQSIREQFPAPSFFSRPESEYRFILPLSGSRERLEVGVTYSNLFSAERDSLVLSGTLFFLAFIFLLGTVLFVDAYVSSFTQRLFQAISVRSSTPAKFPEGLGIPQHLAPTYNALMMALEHREDQLINTRETLQTVFNGLQSGVAMISTEMQIVLVNQFYRTLLLGSGEAESEAPLEGSSCIQLNLAEQFPPIEELCARSLRSMTSEVQEVENQSGRYFLQEAYPLLDAKNEPVAVVVQCRDITNEKIAQQQVHDFNDELSNQLGEQKLQLDEAHQKLLRTAKLAVVGELAGGVAHEINNPNGLILAGSSYVLKRLQNESGIPDYVPRYLERILRQSERVAQIVGALLAFSRRRPLDKELLQIAGAIDDALDLTEARIGKSKLTIHKSLPPDLPLIKGNRGQLSQVFLNLFNNAIDAMPDGGELYISASLQTQRGKAGVSVKVKDTGSGIAPEHLDKILEPFFTTKPVGKGTGLGLSVSLGIVEEHEGSMTVANSPGGGVEFELIFPTTADTLSTGLAKPSAALSEPEVTHG